MMLVAPRAIRSARLKKPSTSESKRVALLIINFETSLADHFKALIPADSGAGSGISLAYLAHAVGVLSSVHAFVASLLGGFDGATLAAYVDRSVKILDICNAVSAEIERLRGGRLHLLLAVRLLSSDTTTSSNFRKAEELIRKWKTASKIKARDETILQPKEENALRIEKNSAGMRTLCAMDAACTLVAEALAATFHVRKADLNSKVEIARNFGWYDAFAKALGSLSARIYNTSSPVEVEAATTSAGALEKIIHEKTDMLIRPAVEDLENAAADLTATIDQMATAISSLFRFTLGTRDLALVSYYRSIAKKCKFQTVHPRFLPDMSSQDEISSSQENAVSVPQSYLVLICEPQRTQSNARKRARH